MALVVMRNCLSCPRAPQMALRQMAKKAPKGGKAPLRKAPPPPKYRKVCRHVFPYPKCIDLFSLRPEPQCIESEGDCGGGSILTLLAGVVLLGLGAYLSFTMPVHMLWHSFEDDDECCDEDD